MKTLAENMNWFQKISQSELFHGTNEDTNPTGWSSSYESKNDFGILGLIGTTRHGIFLTDNQDFAKQYGSKILKFKPNFQNTAILDDRELINDFTETLDPYSDRDTWLLAKYQRKIWMFFENELGLKFTNWLVKQGYDSAQFSEYASSDSGEEVQGTTTVVFDPSLLQPVA